MKKEFTNEQMKAIAEICNRDFGKHYAISQNTKNKDGEVQLLVLNTHCIDESTVTDLHKIVRYISIYPNNDSTLEIHLYQ